MRAESLGEILTEVPVVVVGRPEPPPVVVVVVLVAGFSNLIGRELQSVAGASSSLWHRVAYMHRKVLL